MMTLILILTQEARLIILVLSNVRLCQDLVMSSLFYEHIYTDVFLSLFFMYKLTKIPFIIYSYDVSNWI